MSSINAEFTAQRTEAQPNPAAIELISYVRQYEPSVTFAIDQGCGKLRHLKALSCFPQLLLVDTPLQIGRRQRLDGTTATIPEYVAAALAVTGTSIDVMTSEEFAVSSVGAGLVLNIATFDVVPLAVRLEMLRSAFTNLRPGGLLGLVVPRNDSSILRRCAAEFRYEDGYVFSHHGTCTFFRNFRQHDELVTLSTEAGFRLVRDHSRFRQVSLLFRRI